MPITIKKTIKIHISNSFIGNTVKKTQKEAEKAARQAQSVSIRTKSTTQRYSKG